MDFLGPGVIPALELGRVRAAELVIGVTVAPFGAAATAPFFVQGCLLNFLHVLRLDEISVNRCNSFNVIQTLNKFWCSLSDYFIIDIYFS